MSSVTAKPTVHPFQTDDSRLHGIHAKVLAGQSLDLDDVAALFASHDILAIGWLANFVRERMHGNATRFRVDEIVAGSSDAEENVVVEANFDRLPERVASLTGAVFAGLTEDSPTDSQLAKLKSAGIRGLIGDGVELFSPAIRRRVWQSSADPRTRQRVRNAARDAGLRVPAYFVQREASPQQQAEELLGYRDHAAESFASISYPADATTSLNLAASTGMREMKHIAIARLALLNVQHIKVFSQMLGGKLAQIALRFGASEIDGTSLDPAGNTETRSRELAREISVAGRDPLEQKPARKAIV